MRRVENFAGRVGSGFFAAGRVGSGQIWTKICGSIRVKCGSKFDALRVKIEWGFKVHFRKKDGKNLGHLIIVQKWAKIGTKYAKKDILSDLVAAVGGKNF